MESLLVTLVAVSFTVQMPSLTTDIGIAPTTTATTVFAAWKAALKLSALLQMVIQRG
jgi:hypothetical protein